MSNKAFQIKSKKDARHLTEEIRKHHYSFYYYAPLMGVSGGAITIECPNGQRKCTVYSTGSGWQNDNGVLIQNIVDYIWKERKQINAELRHPDSEWHKKIK